MIIIFFKLLVDAGKPKNKKIKMLETQPAGQVAAVETVQDEASLYCDSLSLQISPG